MPKGRFPSGVITRIRCPAGPTPDAVLNLTQITGANTANFKWDGMRRQKSQTLPTGQVVTHTYGLGTTPGAGWQNVTNGYQVNSTETPVSKVKTEYTPCACSSIGKVLRVSMPYAANASPLHWTTYTYL